MAEILSSLESLGSAMTAKGVAPATPAAPVHVRKVDGLGRSYATGKRKNAVARVYVRPGPGRIMINDRELKTYFARPVLQMLVSSR